MDSVNATLDGEPSTGAPTDAMWIAFVLIVFCVGVSKTPLILIASIVQFVAIRSSYRKVGQHSKVPDSCVSADL